MSKQISNLVFKSLSQIPYKVPKPRIHSYRHLSCQSLKCTATSPNSQHPSEEDSSSVLSGVAVLRQIRSLRYDLINEYARNHIPNRNSKIHRIITGYTNHLNFPSAFLIQKRAQIKTEFNLLCSILCADLELRDMVNLLEDFHQSELDGDDLEVSRREMTSNVLSYLASHLFPARDKLQNCNLNSEFELISNRLAISFIRPCFVRGPCDQSKVPSC